MLLPKYLEQLLIIAVRFAGCLFMKDNVDCVRRRCKLMRFGRRGLGRLEGNMLRQEGKTSFYGAGAFWHRDALMKKYELMIVVST
jgi:hypothetical protein